MTAFEILDRCVERGGAITRDDLEVFEDIVELFVMRSYGLVTTEPTGDELRPVRYTITDKGRAFHASLLGDRETSEEESGSSLPVAEKECNQ